MISKMNKGLQCKISLLILEKEDKNSLQRDIMISILEVIVNTNLLKVIEIKLQLIKLLVFIIKH